MRAPWLVSWLILFSFSGCLDDGTTQTVPEDNVARAPMDPLRLGSHGVETSLYDFGLVVVHDPSLVVYQYPIQKAGSVHFPADGDGPFPLILLMHGRHGTCSILGGEVIFTHVCPSAGVVEPVNSFAGYDGLAANLASHGYVVASLNANQINDRDLAGDSGANARAELVLATIDDLANVNATGGSIAALQGRIDLSRIGLMGHSRGGEGVTRAITLNLERPQPHAIKGVFALAPTDFARWAAPDVAFATLLPYCDGDVYNLQGAWIYDDARELPGGPRYQVLAMGANHNFYNTVWTGDDWGTAGEWCGSEVAESGRDSPTSQRAHGDGLMASFFRLHVGGEDAFAPMWNGDIPLPASLCPEHHGCGERLLLSRHGGQRVDMARDGRTTDSEGPLQESSCSASGCTPAMYSVATATSYSWQAGMSLGFGADAPPGLGSFTFRVALPPQQVALELEVAFHTTNSTSVVSLTGHPALATPPMGGDAKGILSMVEVALPAGFASADLTEIEIRSASSGTMFLADVMLQG